MMFSRVLSQLALSTSIWEKGKNPNFYKYFWIEILQKLTTPKKVILTSLQSEQHPNADQNIQQSLEKTETYKLHTTLLSLHALVPASITNAMMQIPRSYNSMCNLSISFYLSGTYPQHIYFHLILKAFLVNLIQ